MSFFSKIFDFFAPPKKTTSIPAIKDILRTSRVRARDSDGRYTGSDPLTKKDEAWMDE